MSTTGWPSEHLLQAPAFQAAGAIANTQHRALQLASTAYLRAEAIWKSWGITLDDVQTLSDKFWKLTIDPIAWHDGASITLLTIQLNLVVGTISQYIKDRPDLQQLCKNMVEGRTIGQFLLTEDGHGLDAENLETTATLQDNGSFIVNSPSRRASKFMPPTVPVLGKPCWAVVWCRIMVNTADWGVRPVLVQLNDGEHMCAGVSAKLLPTRHGATPVNHSLTHFASVRVPHSALLGGLGDGPGTHADFLRAIWRISVGTLALSAIALPALQIAAHTAYVYSKRRTVGSPPVPILSFRTQQLPVFTAIAQAHVLKAMYAYVCGKFCRPQTPHEVRHAFACIFKATVMGHSQASHFALSERLGAQGMFDHNMIARQASEMRGAVIAEGDALVLCIRLVAELLLGRYAIPEPADTASLLAKHEAGVFAEVRTLVQQYGHRSPQYNAHVLPRSRDLVEAIGHRMAYEAALATGVPQPLVDLYQAHCVGGDIGWYVEAKELSRTEHRELVDRAIGSANEGMDGYCEAMNVGPYCKAPILTEQAWDSFVDGLSSYREAPAARAMM